MKSFIISMVVGFTTLGATSASAAPIIFTDRTAFEAATASGTIGFEGFEDGQNAATLTYPDFTFSETNGINFITNTSVNSFFDAVSEGSGAAWFDDNDNSLGEMVFTAGINAFGLDLSTSAASVINIMTSEFSFDFSSLGAGPSFFGVITDNDFSAVTFAASGGPEIGFDAVAYGNVDVSAVPVPASLPLLLAGLGGMGFMSRRKKSI